MTAALTTAVYTRDRCLQVSQMLNLGSRKVDEERAKLWPPFYKGQKCPVHLVLQGFSFYSVSFPIEFFLFIQSCNLP